MLPPPWETPHLHRHLACTWATLMSHKLASNHTSHSSTAPVISEWLTCAWAQALAPRSHPHPLTTHRNHLEFITPSCSRPGPQHTPRVNPVPSLACLRAPAAPILRFSHKLTLSWSMLLIGFGIQSVINKRLQYTVQVCRKTAPLLSTGFLAGRLASATGEQGPF